jgi:hypothetical protein
MKRSLSVKLLVAVALMIGVVATSYTKTSAFGIGDRVILDGQCFVIGAPVRYRIETPGWRVLPCIDEPSTLGSVRGTAFLDNNTDGKRDAGEPIFGEAWFKVTDGGSWFTCGYVGSDATFGVSVSAGTYYVLPVAPKGYKTTTPRVKAAVDSNKATLSSDIGFTPDPTAPGDACDQYNPPRP